MNREKSIFYFEKYNFEPIANFVHTTEYLAFGKDLLARLYLKGKCIFECIFEDSSDLENLPLLNIDLTLILQFCFLDDLLKLCCLTRYLNFHHNWCKERGTKINFSYIFEQCYCGKNLEIDKHSWLLIIGIFKILNSLKSNYLKAKLPSEQNLQKITFSNSNYHCLEQICVWS